MFYDKQGQPIPSDFHVVRFLPTMLSNDTATEALTASGETVGTSSQILFAGNIVINLLLTASLQYLWALINSQQIVILVPLFNA